MKNRKNLNKEDDPTEINISPLIDMVFILLIFFIVTTVFVEERGLSANTPEPTPPLEQPDPDQEFVSFTVRANGQVLYNDRDIGIAGIRAVVGPAMQQHEHPITVNVEPEAPMSLVVSVIDESEAAGAKQVTMKAVPQ